MAFVKAEISHPSGVYWNVRFFSMGTSIGTSGLWASQATKLLVMQRVPWPVNLRIRSSGSARRICAISSSLGLARFSASADNDRIPNEVAGLRATRARRPGNGLHVFVESWEMRKLITSSFGSSSAVNIFEAAPA